MQEKRIASVGISAVTRFSRRSKLAAARRTAGCISVFNTARNAHFLPNTQLARRIAPDVSGPLCVKRRHGRRKRSCLLCARKLTFVGALTYLLGGLNGKECAMDPA